MSEKVQPPRLTKSYSLGLNSFRLTTCSNFFAGVAAFMVVIPKDSESTSANA